MNRTLPLAALALAGALGLSACGGSSSAGSGAGAPAASSVSAAASSAASPSASDTAAAMREAHMHAFCASAQALGSLTKGAAGAMAMSPAEAAKDFQALAAKVKALRADAEPALQGDVDALVARLGLESMLEAHKASGGAVGEDMKMLDAHKSADDAAIARLTAAVKTQCSVDIT